MSGQGLTPMRVALAEHMKLEKGWYGLSSPRHKEPSGEALTLACEATALAVIDELERDGHEARCFPCIDGGVAFEWFDDDDPRPEAITFRGHPGVWLIEVGNDGHIFHCCTVDEVDECPACKAQEQS